MNTQKAADTLTDGLGSVTGSVDKVERIREIIFGAQARDYAQKFENVQRELLRLNREVEQLNEQLREQEKSFKKQVREEAERLTRQLQEQEQQQRAQLAELDKRQSHERELLDQKHTSHHQDLTGQLQSSQRELATRLRELAEQVNHAKVDRSTLGELLVDLGSRLQTQVAAAPLAAEDELIERLSAELE